MKSIAQNKGKVIVISGPSGSGKTTLRDYLLKDRKTQKLFVKSVSFTTRKMRTGEREGRDYFYISEPEFKRKLRAGKILEWTHYLGYYYATSGDFVAGELRKGKNILLCLDLKGARKIRKLFPASSVTIFIKPPSIKELKKRIEQRCRKTCANETGRRLELAETELLAASKYDYVIVNKNFKGALERLRKIISKEIMVNKGAR
ncbi:MAG: guanylate kinase [Candidatus Omnitrophota bacterium]